MLQGTGWPPADRGQEGTPLVDNLFSCPVFFHLPQENVVLTAARCKSTALSSNYHDNFSGPNISRLNTNTEESHIDIHHPQTAFWMTNIVPCQRRAVYGLYLRSSVSPPMALTFERLILSHSVNTSAFSLICNWGYLLHSCSTKLYLCVLDERSF